MDSKRSEGGMEEVEGSGGSKEEEEKVEKKEWSGES